MSKIFTADMKRRATYETLVRDTILEPKDKINLPDREATLLRNTYGGLFKRTPSTKTPHSRRLLRCFFKRRSSSTSSFWTQERTSTGGGATIRYDS